MSKKKDKHWLEVQSRIEDGVIQLIDMGMGSFGADRMFRVNRRGARYLMLTSPSEKIKKGVVHNG